MSNIKEDLMSANKYKIAEHKKLWWKYCAIKARCYNPKAQNYDRYGKRGIRMCQEWLEGFDNFADWAYSHGYKDGLTIERKDVDGDYCPENCSFITIEEQARNKRNTFWVKYKGEKMSLAELCERLNLNYQTIHDRLTERGMTLEEAIETPKRINVTEFARKCHEHNLPIKTVRDRIRKLGWDEERAFNTPARVCKRRNKTA